MDGATTHMFAGFAIMDGLNVGHDLTQSGSLLSADLSVRATVQELPTWAPVGGIRFLHSTAEVLNF